MPHDPKVWAEIAIVVAMVAVNAAPVLSWLRSKASGVSLGGLSKPADRTPGQVLDCLTADMAFLRDKTDCPPEKLKAFDDIAPYLMHKKGAA